MAKRTYIAPAMEVEIFELNAAIAAGCSSIVDYGPLPEYNPNGSTCDAFGDPFGASAAATDTSFYESGATCTCYYSSGGEGYATS